MRANKLKPSQVAKEANVSRAHLLRLRKGQQDATVSTALRIRDACGRLLLRAVRMNELFEVE